jgi:hypothetical protein
LILVSVWFTFYNPKFPYISENRIPSDLIYRKCISVLFCKGLIKGKYSFFFIPTSFIKFNHSFSIQLQHNKQVLFPHPIFNFRNYSVYFEKWLCMDKYHVLNCVCLNLRLILIALSWMLYGMGKFLVHFPDFSLRSHVIGFWTILSKILDNFER